MGTSVVYIDLFLKDLRKCRLSITIWRTCKSSYLPDKLPFIFRFAKYIHWKVSISDSLIKVTLVKLLLDWDFRKSAPPKYHFTPKSFFWFFVVINDAKKKIEKRRSMIVDCYWSTHTRCSLSSKHAHLLLLRVLQAGS